MIDLRSDTVSRPNQAMRAYMANAEVGDDVFSDDPTVNALESKMAKMTGKQAALLLPSGTQSNLVALLSHCQRGEEYIVGQGYHSYLYEAGGAAVLGSIQPQPISVEKDGSLDLQKVAAVVKPDDSHFARSKLLVLENTHNGKVLSIEYMASARQFTDKHKLSLHLDGARAFNAATFLDVDLKEITKHVDSVSICCSKGLGAPIGSLLCGSHDLIRQARRWRKMVGGGMRQAGIIAAGIDYALDHNIVRLKEDHENARLLAESLSEIPQIKISQPQTNMVFVHLPSAEIGIALANSLEQDNIKIIRGQSLRLVTHLNISREQTEVVAEKMKKALINLLAQSV